MAKLNRQLSIGGTLKREKEGNKKSSFINEAAFRSGKTGIRTPGPVTVNSFQDCRIKPLCHLSVNVVYIIFKCGAKIGLFFLFPNFL